jgi:glucose/arabinose dehydrogenase
MAAAATELTMSDRAGVWAGVLSLKRLPACAIVLATWLLCGCESGPVILPTAQQGVIDRSIVEYPAGFELRPFVRNLTAPTCFCFDTEGSLIIANQGDIGEPDIFGIRANGTRFQVYPPSSAIPLFRGGFHLYGPIGGMLAVHGRIYISHRDADDNGAITSFDYSGNHTTIVAGLPAQGDYSVTDMAVDEHDRLFFGVGTATNSGVIGTDNWSWVRKHPQFSDIAPVYLKLNGFRMDVRNPEASPLLGISDRVINCPYQPWGISNRTSIASNPQTKPTGAIYSVALTGGDLRVEAWGLHNPRGLALDELGILYFTDDGMELRGVRPIKDDPDVLYRLIPGGGKSITWYGWPDYSRDCRPISDPQFQPPTQLVSASGYPDVGFLIDHTASGPGGLIPPDPQERLKGQFPPLSGAAHFQFVPSSGPFRQFLGSAVVALWGNKAPFATSNWPLNSPWIGGKLVLVDPDKRTTTDFVFNTRPLPASQQGDNPNALERPIDAQFGPDGDLYILDYGHMEMRDSDEKIWTETGKIFKLVPQSK